MINWRCKYFMKCGLYEANHCCDGCKEARNNSQVAKCVYGFPKIRKAHFNDPVTVVIWEDGTKTIVRCGENDIYDWEKGLAMAIAKKALGNKGNYYNEFHKWEPEDESKHVLIEDLNSAKEFSFTIDAENFKLGNLSSLISKPAGPVKISFEAEVKEKNYFEKLDDKIAAIIGAENVDSNWYKSDYYLRVNRNNISLHMLNDIEDLLRVCDRNGEITWSTTVNLDNDRIVYNVKLRVDDECQPD